MTSAERPLREVRDYLDEAGIEWELGARDGELVLTLPAFDPPEATDRARLEELEPSA